MDIQTTQLPGVLVIVHFRRPGIVRQKLVVLSLVTPTLFYANKIKQINRLIILIYYFILKYKHVLIIQLLTKLQFYRPGLII